MGDPITTHEAAMKYRTTSRRICALVRQGLVTPILALGSKPYKFDPDRFERELLEAGSLKTESAVKTLKKTKASPVRNKRKVREGLWDRE